MTLYCSIILLSWWGGKRYGRISRPRENFDFYDGCVSKIHYSGLVPLNSSGSVTAEMKFETISVSNWRRISLFWASVFSLRTVKSSNAAPHNKMSTELSVPIMLKFDHFKDFRRIAWFDRPTSVISGADSDFQSERKAHFREISSQMFPDGQNLWNDHGWDVFGQKSPWVFFSPRPNSMT